MLQQQQQATATDAMQQSFSALMRCVATGNPIDMVTMFKTFSIRPTTVTEYATHVLTAA